MWVKSSKDGKKVKKTMINYVFKILLKATPQIRNCIAKNKLVLNIIIEASINSYDIKNCLCNNKSTIPISIRKLENTNPLLIICNIFLLMFFTGLKNSLKIHTFLGDIIKTITTY